MDEVIAIIRACKSVWRKAKPPSWSSSALTIVQAQAIVKMQLGRLTGLEILKIEEELASLQA